jgi:hypothetical protein
MGVREGPRGPEGPKGSARHGKAREGLVGPGLPGGHKRARATWGAPLAGEGRGGGGVIMKENIYHNLSLT